jgi:hypothetical protein
MSETYTVDTSGIIPRASFWDQPRSAPKFQAFQLTVKHFQGKDAKRE